MTAEYTVRFLKPTPIEGPLHLRAWPTKVEGNKVQVEGEVTVGEVPTATMTGTFVAVREGHPAFYRWH